MSPRGPVVTACVFLHLYNPCMHFRDRIFRACEANRVCKERRVGFVLWVPPVQMQRENLFCCVTWLRA